MALILTFIKGENVNNWVSHQLDLLIKRIKNGIRHSDKAHWDLFEADFMTAFVNCHGPALGRLLGAHGATESHRH
jgi:hypothetical protein